MKLICPVCGENLTNSGKSYICARNHTFDTAKEGYVNLLLSGKNGSLTGDSRAMAVSRRDFLNKGYYGVLADAVRDEFLGRSRSIRCAADICCGEGYYTQKVSEGFDGEFYGFDISKEMIRLASKRASRAVFAVANMKKLPLPGGSVDFAMHLFAPFCEEEFARVLSEDGVLVSVRPGRRHLFELKQAVYDSPYENDETPVRHELLRRESTKRVKTQADIKSNQDIQSLFSMTPYFYRTSQSGRQRLDGIDTLSVTFDFLIEIYKKI